MGRGPGVHDRGSFPSGKHRCARASSIAPGSASTRLSPCTAPRNRGRLLSVAGRVPRGEQITHLLPGIPTRQENTLKGRAMKSLWMMTAGLIVSFALTACETAPRSDEGKADIRAEAAAAVSKAQYNDPTFSQVLRDARGYAVFPSVGKGGAGIGGAYGKGVLYEGGSFSGYCDLSQATIGFQLGGQSYTEIITFSTSDALTRFKTGNFAFDAQATAVAVRSGAGANARYSNGVAVFTMDEAGLMYEASIGGQKFSYQAR